MTEGSFVPLPGSERETISGVQETGAVDEAEQIKVTLMTRRRAGLPGELGTGPDTISTEELANSHGTDPGTGLGLGACPGPGPGHLGPQPGQRGRVVAVAVHQLLAPTGLGRSMSLLVSCARWPLQRIRNPTVTPGCGTLSRTISTTR